MSPDEGLAFRILALNTEKAHNLKDRSLEVIRMARELASRNKRAKESDYAVEFEAPELLTLGIIYEENGRFSGGAYSPCLKKVEQWSSRSLGVSLREREGMASRLVTIDQEVKRIIDAAIDKVRHILEVRKDALAAIAAQLLKEEVIDAEELKAIIEENSSSPMIVPGTDAEPKTKRPGDPEAGAGEASGIDQAGSG